MSLQDEQITYMGHHWIQIEGDTVIVGLNEDSLDEIDGIQKINFPTEGEEVLADEPCGDIESTDGNLNIYSPVSGTISEVNPEIKANPSLVFDDPHGDGWLIKVQANDEAEIDQLVSASSGD